MDEPRVWRLRTETYRYVAVLHPAGCAYTGWQHGAQEWTDEAEALADLERLNAMGGTPLVIEEGIATPGGPACVALPDAYRTR
jgi:hypothetical protein